MGGQRTDGNHIYGCVLHNDFARNEIHTQRRWPKTRRDEAIPTDRPKRSRVVYETVTRFIFKINSSIHPLIHSYSTPCVFFLRPLGGEGRDTNDHFNSLFPAATDSDFETVLDPLQKK